MGETKIKMLKKIKDLTPEEAIKICDSHYSCDDCPLDIRSYSYCLKNVIETNADLLEQEVEVEDNEQIHNN